MDRHDRPRHQTPAHRFIPHMDGLEIRRLPSYFGSYSNNYYNQVSYQASLVRHEYDAYVGELKRLELASRATPGEYLALRDDARAISAAASTAKLPDTAVQYRAVEASLILDRAPLYGWLGNAGWAEKSSRLSTALGGLDVPQPLIDQTVADMRNLATSAGVGPDGFAAFTDAFDTLRNGEQSLPANSGYHLEDPSLYYTQHLRGFFRGWGVQKVRAKKTLDRDIAVIQRRATTNPDGAVVVHRDAHILEDLGAAVPSTTKDQFNATYVAAFAQGTPTSTGLAQLRSNLIAILGPAGIASRISSVGRLVADAPAFYQAVGESETNVKTIVTDLGALVDAGGGETLNPFKVTIQTGPRTGTAG